MSIKSLFFKDESSEQEAPKEVKKEATSFPEEKSAPSFPSQPFQQATSQPVVSGNTYFQEVLNVYLTGLESLNQEGIEFFEVLKAVEAVDINNPAAYKMAIQMLQNVDKSFNKDKALNTSQFYIDSVLKAHSDYQRGGEEKKQKLQSDKLLEESTLKNEVSTLESQLRALETTLSEKRMALTTIDSKYQET